MGIANRIIKLMKEKNTNANDLAIKAEIPPSTIYSLIRRDSGRVDVDSLIKIAKALGVSVDYLLGAESENKEIDKFLQEIIDCYNTMTKEGQKFLLEQAKVCLKQFEDTGKRR